ncbi:thialysine N-epsilon-acetyltransferase isoform X2 [Bacillus rossius redtenbacheri]|uniref:thialysine N-epsilon-acetyltransferase isoform X2 n=1 Tax=Bacillus rossius redtenbacheri TaxID=93214 RepID=UPI002FDE5F51
MLIFNVCCFIRINNCIKKCLVFLHCIENLERDGFETDHPLFGCYVVETQVDDNELGKDGVELGSVEENAADGDGDGRSRLVGYALYYQRYSTWNGVSLHLEDLYVSPRFRQQGVGRALFKQVAKECVALGCRQLDFEVLNWNPARKFYEKLGSVNRTENGGWHSYRLAGEALQRLGDGDS